MRWLGQYNLELGAAPRRPVYRSPAFRRADLDPFYGESMPASSSDAQNRRAVFVAQRPRVAAGAGLDTDVDASGNVSATGSASLDVEPTPMAPEPAPAPLYTATTDSSRSHLITPAGMSFVVGGGVMNFTDSDTNSATDMGGMWEARLTYGTRSAIGVEAAYVGSAQDIDALGLDTSAVLLGSSAEAALRVGIPYIPYVQPYAIAGVGVTRFSLVNENFNTSSVDDSETAVDFPLGLGVGFASNGFLFDVRGVYRPMTQDDLINIPKKTDDNENGSLASIRGRRPPISAPGSEGHEGSCNDRNGRAALGCTERR
jgi:hypothetical protein